MVGRSQEGNSAVHCSCNRVCAGGLCRFRGGRDGVWKRPDARRSHGGLDRPRGDSAGRSPRGRGNLRSAQGARRLRNTVLRVLPSVRHEGDDRPSRGLDGHRQQRIPRVLGQRRDLELPGMSRRGARRCRRIGDDVVRDVSRRRLEDQLRHVSRRHGQPDRRSPEDHLGQLRGCGARRGSQGARRSHPRTGRHGDLRRLPRPAGRRPQRSPRERRHRRGGLLGRRGAGHHDGGVGARDRDLLQHLLPRGNAAGRDRQVPGLDDDRRIAESPATPATARLLPRPTSSGRTVEAATLAPRRRR